MRQNRRFFRIGAVRLTLAVLALLAPAGLAAQFDSGSTGANGPFPPIPVPDGTTSIVLSLQDGEVTFNPSGMTATLPNVPDGGFADGVLHFTTVDIPAGPTLSFLPHDGNPPTDILAQGDVNVAGTIDVSGQQGGGENIGGRGFAGPGGFSGGQGRLPADSAGGIGLGPGGGGSSSGGGGHAQPGGNGEGMGGPAYGTPLLRPLIGGSGGGGGRIGTTIAPGGGGGGGAIGIASSTAISISGAIQALGGAGGTSVGGGGTSGAGGGAGGGIRLTANSVVVLGNLNAAGGQASAMGGDGSPGRIRLEAFNQFSTPSVQGALTSGAPGPVVFTNAPRMRIRAVDGVAVPANPNGSLRGADVLIASAGTKTIDVETTNVPPLSTVSVVAKPANGSALIGPVTGQVPADVEPVTSIDLDFPSPGLYFIEAQTVASP